MTDASKDLSELLAKATPGPWQAAHRQPADVVRVEDENGNHVARLTSIVANSSLNWTHSDMSAESQAQNLADAALICALRNAAPDLLRVVEAARLHVNGTSGSGAALSFEVLRQALQRLDGGVP